MTLQTGARASFDHLVTTDDLAIAFGSGDVPVLATPRIVALVERATFLAVRESLEEGQTTVGARAELRHVLPSALGASVQVEAVLAAVDGRTLTYDVRVTGGGRTVAEGTITRVIVTRERFLGRLGS